MEQKTPVEKNEPWPCKKWLQITENTRKSTINTMEINATLFVVLVFVELVEHLLRLDAVHEVLLGSIGLLVVVASVATSAAQIPSI